MRNQSRAASHIGRTKRTHTRTKHKRHKSGRCDARSHHASKRQAADKFTLKLINRYEIVCASCKHIGRHTGSTCTRHNTLTLTIDVMLSAVSSRSHVNSIQRTVSPSNYFIFSSVHLVCVCTQFCVRVCVACVRLSHALTRLKHIYYICMCGIQRTTVCRSKLL